jgi:hypothetical protein
MRPWTSGYTRTELDLAQARFGLRFPPDLAALRHRYIPEEPHAAGPSRE